MANINYERSKKNLISRRALLNSSLLTGLSLATGFQLTSLLNTPEPTAGELELKDVHRSLLVRHNPKSKEETYMDNFDC